MNKLFLISLLALSSCASARMEWTPIGSPKSSLAEASTDCEHKARQVAHTFNRYDMSALEGFVRRCMASHGYSGTWVKG